MYEVITNCDLNLVPDIIAPRQALIYCSFIANGGYGIEGFDASHCVTFLSRPHLPANLPFADRGISQVCPLEGDINLTYHFAVSATHEMN